MTFSHDRRPGRRLLRRTVLTAATAGVALTMAGCSSAASDAGGAPFSVASSATSDGIQGSQLDTPVAKPAGVLTDTAGQPYDIATATAGRLTLLYFGYTHCPDVCPTTMADLNVALSQVPAQVRSHTTVVFVTTDPARDTGPVIRSWLDAFNSSFVGLTGSVTQIDRMAGSVGVSIEPPVTEPDGTISVTHGAQVLAFSPTDNRAHVLYTAGSGPDEYAHDLPLLAAGQT